MPPRRRRKARSSSRPLVLALAAVVALAVIFAVLLVRREKGEQGGPSGPAAPAEAAARPPEQGFEPLPPTASRPEPAPDQVPAGPPPAGLQPLPGPAGGGARIALVIDDLGRSLADLEQLEALGIPLTYSVLPFESHTGEVVRWLSRRQREVLCHLPMEPGNGADPGPGALEASMAVPELIAATEAALAAVPEAVGVNNHMGSRLSADRQAMGAVLGVLARRGLFFLDSRTSAESVAFQTARSLGLAAAERQVFLDRDPSPEAIDLQLDRLLALASQRGAAIAIGHPYPETFQALARRVPRAREAGYEFVPVSFLLDDSGEPPL